MPYQELVGWAAELALDPVMLPGPPSSLEGFRKAATETRCSYQLPDGMRAQVQLHPLDQDPDRVVRSLVRQITARSGLYHDQVGAATFWRPPKVDGKRTAVGERMTVTLDYDRLADYERPHLEQLAEQLRSRYDHYRTHVDGDNLRDLVRRLLTGLRALRMNPSGAVYFVAAERFGELRRVGILAERAGIVLRSVLVADTAEHRSMLIEVVHEQASYQVALLAANLETAVARRGELSTGVRARLTQRAHLLLASLAELAELLEIELSVAVVDELDALLDRLVG